jgi:hypothetical protein
MEVQYINFIPETLPSKESRHINIGTVDGTRTYQMHYLFPNLMQEKASTKINADEYLQELADHSDGWLKSLIEQIITVREVPNEDFLRDVL